ncbi:MAG: hypothetical protein WCE21_02280 [Candidatus Babeliales bacterium]
MKQHTISATVIVAIAITQSLFAMEPEKSSWKNKLKKIGSVLLSFTPSANNKTPLNPVVVNNQTPFNWLPKEIRTHITSYITHETEEECAARIAQDIRNRGIGLHLRKFEDKKIRFQHFTFALNDMNSLSLTLKQATNATSRAPDAMKQLYCAQGDSLREKMATIGGLTLMYDSTRQVTHCNVSCNNKFLTYLVARYNKITNDFKPVSLHIVDIKQRKEIKKFELEQLIKHSEASSQCDAWQPNRQHISINGADNDQIREKKSSLKAIGYVELKRTSRLTQNGCVETTVLGNDILGIACDSNGNFVAIADYTGVMLIDMVKGTITKVVQENLSSFNTTSDYTFHIDFNKSGTLLVYGSQTVKNKKVSAPQWHSIAVPHFIDTNEDHLKKWLHDNRVCKKLLSCEQQ